MNIDRNLIIQKNKKKLTFRSKCSLKKRKLNKEELKRPKNKRRKQNFSNDIGDSFV